MTLERLKNYRQLVFSICRMEEQLAEIDTKLTRTTTTLTGMPKCKTPKDITNELLAQRVDLHDLINKKLVSASVEVAQISQAILELPEPARSIFRMRYLDGQQWAIIAVALNYGRSQVFKIHYDTVSEMGW